MSYQRFVTKLLPSVTSIRSVVLVLSPVNQLQYYLVNRHVLKRLISASSKTFLRTYNFRLISLFYFSSYILRLAYSAHEYYTWICSLIPTRIEQRWKSVLLNETTVFFDGGQTHVWKASTDYKAYVACSI